MPDKISPEARALIDAAIPRMTRRFPTGTSAQATPVWDPKAGALRNPDYDKKVWAFGKVIGDAETRRAKVLAMSMEGIMVAEIGRRLGVSESTITADRRILLDAGHTFTNKRIASSSERARALRLIADGATNAVVSAEIGIARSTVSRWRQEAKESA